MLTTRPAATDLNFFSKSKSPNVGASSASPITVTTRVVTVQRTPNPASGALKVTARSATPVAKSRTPPTTTAKKRKVEGAGGSATAAKRPRLESATASTSSRAQSESRSRAPSVAPLLDVPVPANFASKSSSLRSSPFTAETGSSRSRSASLFPTPEPPAPRKCWTEEDGRAGDDFLSSEVIVQSLMKSYKAYFCNPDDPSDKSWEPHPTDYPVSELEYPNDGACERFILLAPKDKDHYNPIMCLETSLHTIIECYLTPAQQALFGNLHTAGLTDEDEFRDDHSLRSSPSPQHSTEVPPPSCSPTPSNASSSSSSSTSSISSTLSSMSSLSSLSQLSCYSDLVSISGRSEVNCLKLFQRAVRKRDGPLFLKVMNTINAILRMLKYPTLSDPYLPCPENVFRTTVKSWSQIPERVFTRIVDETYQRAVGPHVASLSRYEAFSSEVYGELMPSFVAEIVKSTGLREDALFVDLGSGVGNVVLQASLQTGCKGFGVEIMSAPAKCARSQKEQLKIRCRMWGVVMGDVELEEGDMLKSSRVDELIPKADVLLVNNKVFLESLNEAIRPKFLDLKEGAIVVSLKPFVSSSRLTGRNLDDISAIFQVTERSYFPGSVSWGSGGGSYFLHRVDRQGYADIKRQVESSRYTSSRSTRSRK
ncbi:DOT1-domain-containing protein [Obba rivulosa]|uniref:Histone-lysine N-methyltransferase, H3 lysine-79 specific n=1 Tax=Obba rivulosa TaxID=1052685 RepID=A0A8E2APP6_9APHY|nr:DOT1-domain-containing protein [Obba rivulosa]